MARRWTAAAVTCLATALLAGCSGGTAGEHDPADDECADGGCGVTLAPAARPTRLPRPGGGTGEEP